MKNEIIERGAGLSDLIANHNARIGIGRGWARLGLKLFVYRRKASRFAAWLGVRRECTMITPKPILKAGIIYSGDNGMRICIKCAGQSALYTGPDLSGQKVMEMTEEDNALWIESFGKPLDCECGLTKFSSKGSSLG